ncbi:MAG: ring-hydroxylating dioxygenase ferredoxin reductase family protein [Hyphomicrobiales bacterium]|nr:ring-hydroxylating dioxygenase ferredoxin reductase family protein [Hyphomicrobiales bacterium]
MSFTIALNFEDGVTRFIGCKPGEKVLDAAYRQKVNLPMDCSDGVCGTCKAYCEQGDYDLGEDYLEEALSEEQAAEGMVLTCQMEPSSDCVINVPAASTVCKTQVATYSGSVAGIEWLSDSSVELKVDLDEGAELGFLPGQYVHIHVPGSDQNRYYSFSSLPGNKRATFLIRNIPNGLMSSYLSERAKVGESLSMSGPHGSFYLREIKRPVLMLAGGTGLAPFLSMLEQLAEKGCDQPVHLIYGVTYDADLVKLGALDDLAARMSFFSYDTCVASDDSSHPRKGYVTQHMDASVLHGGDVDVYLCGPPPMVDAVLRHFDDEGIAPQSFHYEKFTPNIATVRQVDADS